MREFLQFRRDPRNPAQLAEACERFRARTGRVPTLLGIRPGTEPPKGEHSLQVVEDRPLPASCFWVGTDE